MKFGVVQFPGSNCDGDAHHAVEKVTGHEAVYLWHKDVSLQNIDCVILPGGFSYGDYLRAGALARFSKIMRSVEDFAKKGGLVIGICNGFQILLEYGLLSGAMLHNDTSCFICKDVFLKTLNNNTPFTNQLKIDDIIKIPIAHAEGKYYNTEEEIKRLEDNNQIIFKYCDKDGKIDPKSNPNGSLNNIAGICNDKKNIFGLMPHPERAMEDIFSSTDGKLIFASILESFSN